MTKVDKHITCWKKVVYRQLIDAELAAAQLWESKKHDVVPYKCDICPFYHLSGQGWTIKKIEALHRSERRKNDQI